MKNETCESKEFKSATKFVVRCLAKLDKGDFEIEGNDRKDKYRLLGRGAPKKTLELILSLFDYFIDIRTELKGILPRKLLLAKANELYIEYCELKEKAGEEP